MTWTFKQIANHLLGDSHRGLSRSTIDDGLPPALRGRVPKVLMEFWQQVGGATELLDCFQHIASPDKVELRGEHLLFMEENQGVCLWGCVCDEDDPQVFQYAVMDSGLDGPHPEHVCLSDFLAAMLVMQAVQSQLLTHTGYCVLPLGEGAAMFKATMHALPQVGGFLPFIGDGAAVGIIIDGEEETVLAATNSSAAFARIAKQLEIDPADFSV
jgi:hypothetical protein